MRTEELARLRLLLASSRKSAFMTAFGLLVSILVAGCGVIPGLRPASEPGPALQASAAPVWYARNEPLIKAYLESLPNSAIGKSLPGIRLSDGNLWLGEYIYLGPGLKTPPGLSVRLVENQQILYAYMWMEEGADPYALTPCPDGPQKGIRARKAGGGAFAWKQLNAKEGVIYTECPPDDWLPDGVLPTKASDVK